MRLDFSSPVTGHYFALRCVPQNSARQKICLTRCQVLPEGKLNEIRDGFGNMKLTGCILDPHDFFEYNIEGIAMVRGMGEEKEPLHPMYKYPSRYTAFEPVIADYGMRLLRDCQSQGAYTPLEKAVLVMNDLYRHFSYEPFVTGIHTTAAQALSLGKGVCQDFAHIMIALMRYLGVPARYVNGLMIGEGFSHAWVEIYTGTGWYGLDPTNCLHIDDYYIKLAWGRDYGDCVVDKGRFLGSAAQTQNISVNVEEIRDDSDCCIHGTAGGRAPADQKEPDHAGASHWG